MAEQKKMLIIIKLIKLKTREGASVRKKFNEKL